MRVYAPHLLAATTGRFPNGSETNTPQDDVPTQPGAFAGEGDAMQAEVARVMATLGCDEIQARHHVQCREQLRAKLPRGVRR